MADLEMLRWQLSTGITHEDRMRDERKRWAFLMSLNLPRELWPDYWPRRKSSRG